MDWNDIRVSLAIARAGSLNQAALLLGMDQSTVSRRLTALEAKLGTTLFQRSSHGVLPTEAGSVFVAKAIEIERQAGALVDQVKAAGGSHAGVLHVCGDQWILKQLAAFGLLDFMAKNPEVEVVLNSEGNDQRAWHQNASVALCFTAKPVDGAFAIKLGAVPHAVYAADGKNPHAWVRLHKEQDPLEVKTHCADGGAIDDMPCRLRTSDPETVLTSVAAGVGKAILPRCLGDADIRLKCISKREGDLYRNLYLHVHPDALSSKRVEAMVAFLRASFADIFLPHGASRAVPGDVKHLNGGGDLPLRLAAISRQSS